MSELSYKELQEKGVFDVPYRAFEFMQQQQKEIDELNLTIKRLIISEEDIAKGCKAWRDAHRELDERIERTLAWIEDEGNTYNWTDDLYFPFKILKGEVL